MTAYFAFLQRIKTIKVLILSGEYTNLFECNMQNFRIEICHLLNYELSVIANNNANLFKCSARNHSKILLRASCDSCHAFGFIEKS